MFVSGIGSVATNGDLVDRTVTLELPSIVAEPRRVEADLEAAFVEKWPSSLGALLDLMVRTLRELPKG